MHDTAPPYLDRCREMSFDEHAAFVRDCLTQRYEPDPGGERSYTKDEFLAVWRLLREKSDAMPPDPPPQLNPLDKAYDKLKRTEDYLYGRTPGKPRPSKKDARRIERELDRLEEEIERMEDSGKYDGFVGLLGGAIHWSFPLATTNGGSGCDVLGARVSVSRRPGAIGRVASSTVARGAPGS